MTSTRIKPYAGLFWEWGDQRCGDRVGMPRVVLLCMRFPLARCSSESVVVLKNPIVRFDKVDDGTSRYPRAAGDMGLVRFAASFHCVGLLVEGSRPGGKVSGQQQTDCLESLFLPCLTTVTAVDDLRERGNRGGLKCRHPRYFQIHQLDSSDSPDCIRIRCVTTRRKRCPTQSKDQTGVELEIGLHLHVPPVPANGRHSKISR